MTTHQLPKEPVLRLPRNVAGRDFVIGDTHGSFDPVAAFMRTAEFNRREDRLFSCGDTIDRGPQPERSLRFVRFANTVLGNHEDFFLQLRQMERDGHDANRVAQVMHRGVGCGWYASATQELKFQLEQAFSALPIAIEVETDRGLVGIVHADVPKNLTWPQFLDEVEQGNQEIIGLAIGREDASRNRVYRNEQRFVQGVGRVYVGHTPVHQVQRLGNVYAIDTGSVTALDEPNQGYRLTAAMLNCKTSALLSVDVFEQHGVHIIDETPEESGTPFSSPCA
jgi:serine/threonine protein phosphatase 1